ncbi:BTB domain-containing protein [Favolaschia claudopus]|uniref:BTB domain-containing protein n=1 Tax=Favolaschia claudopus TaxID=2862362 RepID=A0AAW0BCW9_9AGAR
MSSTPTSPPPHKANARIPFSGATSTDSDTRPTDFILRSSGGVDFHVRKDMLKALSDFFDDMFSMVEKGRDGEDLSYAGKTVLALPESTKVLYALLSIAYPRQQPSVGTPEQGLGIDEILEMMEAAQKYRFVIAEPLVKNLFGAPALIQENPHRIFAIAHIHQLPADIVRKAALGTLRFPVTPRFLEFPEMDRISWSTAQRLFDFHQTCGTRVAETLGELIKCGRLLYRNNQTKTPYIWWHVTGDDSGMHNAPCGARMVAGKNKAATAAPWFTAHFAKVLASIRASPAPLTVLTRTANVAPSERTLIKACILCRKRADDDLKNLAEGLTVQAYTMTEEIGKWHYIEEWVLLIAPAAKAYF